MYSITARSSGPCSAQSPLDSISGTAPNDRAARWTAAKFLATPSLGRMVDRREGGMKGLGGGMGAAGQHLRHHP